MSTLKHIELFERYLRLRNRSENTVLTYSSIVSKFLNQFKVHPSNITENDISNYLLNIESPRTRNQTIGCLKTFFRYVLKRPNMVSVPYASIPKKHPLYISKEKFESDIVKCTNSKHRLIFRLMFNHGLRVGEVLNCKVGWFSSQAIDGTKYYTINVTGKGAKDRLICLCDESVSELKKYAKAFKIDLTDRNQFLFRGQNGGRYSKTSVQNLTKKYFGVNPHALRHSCATELVNKDVNQKKIQDLLGHSSSKTTEIYSHTSIKSMIGVSA